MNGKRWALLLGIAALAAPATAQQTVQQQFEAASAALAESKWQDALAIYEQLEARLARGKNARSLALVRVRKGEALANLRRDEEARTAIESGLPQLPTTDPSLSEDRLLATLVLGEMSERGLDYAQAIKHYRAVETATDMPMIKARALIGLTRTGMFSDSAAALADVDRLIALVKSHQVTRKQQLAPFQTLRGRTLLNMRRYREASDELVAATRGLGGLTLKVDANDIAARSDAALALLLAGRADDAREYLAFTGAGRISNGFEVAAEMAPPPCGGDGDLAPADVAVVEFAIRDDGSVGHVAPVYWSRQGLGVLAYAEAVRAWSWRPDQVAKIPPLLRALTRVELRCSTASERPTPLAILDSDVDSWLTSKNVMPLPEESGSDAIRARTLVSELARREAQHGTASIHLVPVLSGLADNSAVTNEERGRYARRAIAIANDAGAPGPVLAAFEMRHVLAESVRGGRWRMPEFGALYEDPAIKGDPRAAAAVRLQQAVMLGQWRRGREAEPLLEQVRDMPGLMPNDPLRVGALVRLSSVELANGDVAAAQAAFAATGLTAQQCALIDAGPGLKRMGADSSDFPEEAMRWGFEGWATIEHDIAADGRTANQRTTIAYPPFVFGESAVGVIKGMRYERSYRPDGSLGCGGKRQRIVFRLPG